METPVREMPRYKSHKTVWALKIAQVVPKENPDPTGQSAAASYGARIVPADEGYAPFDVPAEYVTKHNPQPGGYYVVYADGYKSFSPAKAFEEGNTRILDTTTVPPIDAEADAPAGTVSVLNGGASVITLDDGCFVLKNLIAGEWKSATHIFPEALEAMQALGDPRVLQQRLVAGN